jgi:hypothetical protein
MTTNPENPNPVASEGTKLKAFLTGAIVAASALAGGLAVVLWNRTALSRLRQSKPAQPSYEADADEE